MDGLDENKGAKYLITWIVPYLKRFIYLPTMSSACCNPFIFIFIEARLC